MSYQTGQGWPQPSTPPPAPPGRGRVVLIVALVLAAGVVLAGCLAAMWAAAGVPVGGPTEGPVEDRVSQGGGANAAAADVVDVELGEPDATGWRTVRVEIVNRSSKTSDYWVELRVEDAEGANIGTATVTAERVKPGQTAKVEDPLVRGSAVRVVLTEVQRTASI